MPRNPKTITPAKAQGNLVRAKSLEAEALLLHKDGATYFFELGVALRSLLRERLYRELGHASFGKYLAASALFGRSQAAKLIAIVDAVPREQALALGLERAYALARVLSVTHARGGAEAALSQGLRLGRERHDVRAMSRRELERARKQVAKGKRAPSAKEAVADKLGTRLALELRQRGAKQAQVEVVRSAHGYGLRIDLTTEDAARILGVARTGRKAPPAQGALPGLSGSHHDEHEPGTPAKSTLPPADE